MPVFFDVPEEHGSVCGDTQFMCFAVYIEPMLGKNFGGRDFLADVRMEDFGPPAGNGTKPAGLQALQTFFNGNTRIAGNPVDFIASLAALVPKPRVNLTRYHGILAPNHRWRGLVTPARRGKGIKSISNAEVRTPAERHAAMTWAQRLKRVFNIDIEVCSLCGGSVRVIACIEDQDVIDQILAHLREKEKEAPARPLLVPPTRAPPATLSLFAGTELNQQGRH